MGSEDYEFNIIKNASGKLPVIRGLDYMGEDFSGCNRRAKAWAAKGGIVTICWHCGADSKGSHTEALDATPDWTKLLTPGTSEYNALIAGMDKSCRKRIFLSSGDRSMNLTAHGSGGAKAAQKTSKSSGGSCMTAIQMNGD